jgi:hypothetical protein
LGLWKEILNKKRGIFNFILKLLVKAEDIAEAGLCPVWWYFIEARASLQAGASFTESLTQSKLAEVPQYLQVLQVYQDLQVYK